MYIKRSDFNSEDDAGDSFVSVAASEDWIGWCRIADDITENASIGDDNCRSAAAAESSHIRWMAMVTDISDRISVGVDEVSYPGKELFLLGFSWG